MYIKEAHIMIEQGLQNIAVFAHSDIDPQEVDIAIKQEMWKMMDEDFPNKEKGTKISKPKQDKYALLIEKENEIFVSLNSRGDYENAVPNNYFHLIKQDAVVLYECGRKLIKSGELIEGEWYQNIGKTPITYNNTSFSIRSIFKADSVLTYTSAINTKPEVIKLKRRISPIRFQEEEFVTTIKDNGLLKSSIESPIAVLAGKKIFTSVDGFFIEKVYISYLKKPSDPNYKFQTFSSGTSLIEGKEYEVIEGSITYNDVNYTYKEQPFILPSFIVGAPILGFTGTGKVRLKEDGDIVLPYETCLKIIDKVILRLEVNSEQPQTKIQNTAQLNN